METKVRREKHKLELFPAWHYFHLSMVLKVSRRSHLFPILLDYFLWAQSESLSVLRYPRTANALMLLRLLRQLPVKFHFLTAQMIFELLHYGVFLLQPLLSDKLISETPR